MTTRLHVGNLPVDTTSEEITTLFRQEGHEVVRIALVMSRKPGRSRGFAFLEMADAESTLAAAATLDGLLLKGRELRVRQAYPPKSRYGGFCLTGGAARSAPSDTEPRPTP